MGAVPHRTNGLYTIPSNQRFAHDTVTLSIDATSALPGSGAALDALLRTPASAQIA